MDLSVHQAMLAIALKRAKKELAAEGQRVDLGCFKALWLGNMLTDVNQGTAFFDAIDNFRPNPYSINDNIGQYIPSPSLERKQEYWEKLIKQVWLADWKRTKADASRPSSILAELGENDNDIVPGNLYLIRGYDPLDHFDVVDAFKDGKPCRSEAEELSFSTTQSKTQTVPLLSRTAYEGVYEHAVAFLSVAFAATKAERITEPVNLRLLGQALHTLQDFFGHSNFVEILMLLAAHRIPAVQNRLQPVLQQAQRDELLYLYYPTSDESLTSLPVVTGRFDRADTVWTLLGIWRNQLLPEQTDLWQGGIGVKSLDDPHHQFIFNILFGCFSDNTPLADILNIIEDIDGFKHALESVNDFVLRGVSALMNTVAKLFLPKPTAILLREFSDLFVNISKKDLQKYHRVADIDFIRTDIVKSLRERSLEVANLAPKALIDRYREELRTLLPKLIDSSNGQQEINEFVRRVEKELDTFSETESARGIPVRILPHHTLLAKDHDVSQPEQRLFYKIACCLATDVSREILVHYFRGDPWEAAEATLKSYYQHPARYLEQPGMESRVTQWVEQLYGVRWYQYALS